MSLYSIGKSSTKTYMNGNVLIQNTNETTSSSTGSVLIYGGISIGSLNCYLTTNSTSISTGSVIISGGAGIAKSMYVGSTIDSTSTSTGSLVISGGLAISKNLNTLTETLTSSSNSTSTTTGSIICNGGVSVVKELYVGGAIINTKRIYVDARQTLQVSPTLSLSTMTFNSINSSSEFSYNAGEFTYTGPTCGFLFTINACGVPVNTDGTWIAGAIYIDTGSGYVTSNISVIFSTGFTGAYSYLTSRSFNSVLTSGSKFKFSSLRNNNNAYWNPFPIFSTSCPAYDLCVVPLIN